MEASLRKGNLICAVMEEDDSESPAGGAQWWLGFLQACQDASVDVIYWEINPHLLGIDKLCFSWLFTTCSEEHNSLSSGIKCIINFGKVKYGCHIQQTQRLPARPFSGHVCSLLS